MRKTKFFIATLLVVVAASVAVVSCKKENPNTLLNNTSQNVERFTPPQVADMNAYLKDFKAKMQNVTRDGDEILSLEEAAWHLSSLANYDFANANVECDDVRFDTLYAQVNITEGTVLLSDMAQTYQTVSSNIDKFYQSLALDNKHFRFINAFISENGEVVISLLTTFSYGSKYLSDTCWHFADELTAYDSCYYYFDLPSYPVQTTGTTELQRVLNLIVSHTANGHGYVYYTPSYTKKFYYRDYIDPYGSPCYMNSRIFANNGGFNCDILPWLCYLLDSYLGLGFEFCPNDEYILSWNVRYYCCEDPMQGEHFSKEYQKLSVCYGTRHEHTPEPGNGNES